MDYEEIKKNPEYTRITDEITRIIELTPEDMFNAIKKCQIMGPIVDFKDIKKDEFFMSEFNKMKLKMIDIEADPLIRKRNELIDSLKNKNKK
ncbi:MAG: hypothetical protein JXA43_03095 [Candidatus Diapherotrites archaeon]|nr:hypothetical protein [Candidatus Diapherotrites archaeon]